MDQHHSPKHACVPPEGTPPHLRSCRRAAALLVGVAMVTGCGSGADRTVPVGVASFEEYRDSARLLMVDGQPIYNVEFDLFFNEERLFEHYMARLQESEPELVDKSVVIQQVSTGRDLTFQRGEDALTITYCVSTAFGAHQVQAIQDMQDATADWQAAANFRFLYDPSQNGNCTGGVAGIDVAVIPSIDFESACATPPYFPPSEQWRWCSGYTQGTLGFDYANWQWSLVGDDTTSRGVMRHELGHILGLRHEHAFSPTATPPCTEGPIGGDIGGRELTSYDIDSVMHYPQCGNGVWTFPITAKDAVGVREIYGMPAAWYPALSQPVLL